MHFGSKQILCNRGGEYLSLILSFFILMFAQPDWSIGLSILASTLGYGLAFTALTKFPSRKKRFLVSTLFFALIQFVHLSWFMADEYVGSYIYLILLLLVLGLGAQFGIFILFISKTGEPREGEVSSLKQKLPLLSILAAASLWTLLEWTRLFFLSGYPFNPVGLALSATLYGMQLTSIFGIFGLTFWVIMTNLFFYKRAYLFFIIAAFFPYFFGWMSVSYHDFQMNKKKEDLYSVVLVQTGLKPEQKIPFGPSSQTLSLIEQWEHILSLLQPYQDKELDLILFSEGQVPYGTTHPYYSRSMVEDTFKRYLKQDVVFPGIAGEKVGNSFWAQSLSNAFNADVIIGLEDIEYISSTQRPHVYNAAFVHSPFNEEIRRYEKRVLVPMGEYIPFAWCKKILSKYGITDSYQRGKKAKVFKTERASYGLSICYEEAFGHLMRENRLHRANILVNLTNDIWYPRSRLPYVHYLHGRLRAVEGGIPLVRACNSGVTCGIDSVGRLIHLNDTFVLSEKQNFPKLANMLLFESSKTALLPASCHLFVPTYSSFTIYTYLGDALIIGVSFLFLLLSCTLFLHKKVRKR